MTRPFRGFQAVVTSLSWFLCQIVQCECALQSLADYLGQYRQFRSEKENDMQDAQLSRM
jgi:hypothetical protein